MNREIKFRAWDGERMKEVLTLGLNEGFISTPKTVAPIEDFKLMQYTGLKDKNGKNIYEGDIVCYVTDVVVENIGGYDRTEPEGSIGSIEFSNGSFWVKGHESGFYDYGEQVFLWSELQVIGNIYENPELLNN